MALLEVRKLPDPVLRQPAKKVPSIDSSVQRLIDDMIETMRAVNGVGLAAPQVGVSLRLAVIEIPDEEVITLVNPVVIKRKGERLLDEGCLSVPGYHGEVKRSVVVKVKALDREGREFRLTANDDLLAHALEHETDHLDGKLYIDLIETPEQLWRTDSRILE